MASQPEQDVPSIVKLGQWESVGSDKVKTVHDEYSKRFESRCACCTCSSPSCLWHTDRMCGACSDEAALEVRKKEAVTLTNQYYDLVTDFFEYSMNVLH